MGEYRTTIKVERALRKGNSITLSCRCLAANFRRGLSGRYCGRLESQLTNS